jgi:hypothetical protein
MSKKPPPTRTSAPIASVVVEIPPTRPPNIPAGVAGAGGSGGGE